MVISFYHFNEDELHIINGFLRLSGRQKFTGGYDNPNGNIGMIRLYDGQECNPKFHFEEADDGVELNLC